jgi:small subunit ribosomal protein S9
VLVPPTPQENRIPNPQRVPPPSTGQAGAIRLAIARALIKTDPELYPALKIGRMLTRVPAEVESKKAGRKKARKKFTWVKR